MGSTQDDELVARLQRLCQPAAAPSIAAAPGRPGGSALSGAAAASSDRDEAARLLQELLDVEMDADSSACCFPTAPTTAMSEQQPEQQKTLPAAAALRAHAEANWCHICRVDAWVWCADCDTAPFCARCWRDTHTPAWTDPALRKHRTVPCTANRVEKALPAPPPNVAPAAPPTAPRPTAPQCQTCCAPVHVWCLDCDDSPFCARCWRDIHKLSSELLRHRTVRKKPA